MSRIPTVLSALALTVSLTGAGAFAATQMNGASIKNGTIGVAKLTPKAVKQLHGAKGDTGDPGTDGEPGLSGTGVTGTPGTPGAPGLPGLPGGFVPAKVSYVTGASVSVPAALFPGDPASIGSAQANCPAGTKVIGGGFFSSIIHAAGSAPFLDGHGWFVIVVNDSSIAVDVSAYAVCAAP